MRHSSPSFLCSALGPWLRGNLLLPVGFVLDALHDQIGVLPSIALAGIVIGWHSPIISVRLPTSRPAAAAPCALACHAAVLATVTCDGA